MIGPYVYPTDARFFLDRLPDASVDLLLTDPPYFGIVEDSWDNQWSSMAAFVDWLVGILEAARPKLKPTGSLVLFGGIGRHGQHPLFPIIERLEATYTYRNWITWGKRREIGRAHV
jgi:DNA modification methylase